MSFSGLLTALAEYVGDVLVNDCGRPIPDRVLRYHGVIPDDCCTDAGTLAVSWVIGTASSTFGTGLAAAPADPCVSMPTYTVAIRYRVCWPLPEAEGPLLDPQWDETAAMLADTADCVTRALAALACEARSPGDADPLMEAVWAMLSRRQWLRLVDVSASVPLGGCAGVVWRLLVAPRAGAAS